MIARLESEVISLTQKLCDKILVHGSEPLDVTVAYSNLTTDVISGYCFGERFGLLEQSGVCLAFTSNQSRCTGAGLTW